MTRLPATETPEQLRRRREQARCKGGGCSTCRLRRIPCDGRKPVCKSCLVGGRKCVFEAASASSQEKPLELNRWGFLSRGISAAPADPFNCLPIDMVNKSPEFFYHFTYFQTRVRVAFPHHPYAQGMNMSHPVFFRSALLVHASHEGAVRDSREAARATTLYHKGEVIQVLRHEVKAKAATEIPEWVLHVISGLMFPTLWDGQMREAEAHLHGLLLILDAMESLHGPCLTIHVFRRKIFMAITLLLGFMMPAREDEARDKTTFHRLPRPNTEIYGQPRPVWTDVPYLFCHIVLEHQAGTIFSSLTGSGGRSEQRQDGELLKWLLSALSSPEGTRDGFYDKEGGGRRLPLSAGAAEELWVWTTVLGAYALTFGSTRDWEADAEDASTEKEGQDVATGKGGSPAVEKPSRGDWLDEWIRTWRFSGKPLEDWAWQEILDKIVWLRTDEGIAHIRQLCEEVAGG